MAEYDSWEKKEDLENTKKLVTVFERRMNAEVRRQEKLDLAEKKDFRRGKLPGKKILYEQDNRKFKNEYLKKLERNQRRWKRKDKTGKKDQPISSSKSRNLEGGVMSDI